MKMSGDTGSWLEVQVEDRTLRFSTLSTHPGGFVEAAKAVAEAGLDPPTFGEASIFVAEVMARKGEESLQEAFQTIQDRWVWADTALLYVPEEGVYIQDHPEETGKGLVKQDTPGLGALNMEPSVLKSLVESGNPSVRFVPYGYKVGPQSPSEVESNPLIIALTGGTEGAGKLAEAASRFSEDPCVQAFDKVDEPHIRVTGLGLELDGTRLDIIARGFDIGPNGNGMCAFGLART